MPEAQPPTERRREEFPTLQNGVYLLSHSLGPMPRSAYDEMERYVDRWRDHTDANAWDAEWWALQSEIGDAFGRLVGAPPGTVAIQPNATVAMHAAASCFEFSGAVRRKVVTTALDFPSMGYLWDAQRRNGAQIHVVPSDEDISVPTERILDAIDESTALVAISYVSYRSSNRVDAPAIVERAHAVGARVLLDAYQAVGVCEIDATRWNVDMLIGGSIKWLCGGPACGYLYVRPDLIESLEPRLTGWFAHARPFDFEHGPMEYDRTIRRFANGTPGIPALYSVRPGMRIIEQFGVEHIARENRRRTQRIVEFAREHGWTLHSPQGVDRRGGTVMIEARDPAAFAAHLARHKIFVDSRPGVGIRLSPHFFNTDEEIEHALNIIAEQKPIGGRGSHDG